MGTIELKAVYPGVPNGIRGEATHISCDRTGLTDRIVYPSGCVIVVRSMSGSMKPIVYSGHSANVSCAAFGPSGDMIVSGDDSGNVRIWQIRNDGSVGKELGEFSVMGGKVRCVAVDEKGEWIVAGGENRGGFVKVVKVKGGRLMTCKGHGKRVNGCDVGRNGVGVITASEDMTVGWFEGPPVKELGVSKFMNFHSNFVNDVKFSPDGSFFATASSDRKVCVVDTKTKQVVKTLEGHQGSVTSVAWTKNGNELVSSSNDKTTKIWDVTSGECVSTITYGKNVNDMQIGCCYIPKSSEIVSASLQGDLSIVSKGYIEPRAILRGHSKQIVGLALVGTTAYTADYTGHLVTWNVDTGSSLKAFTGKGPTSVCAIAANASEIINSGQDGTVFVTSATDMNFRNPVVVKGGGVDICVPEKRCSEFSAIAINESRLTAVATGGGSLFAELEFERSEKGTCVAIRCDGSLIAIGLEVMGGAGEVRFLKLVGSEFKVEGDKIQMHSAPNRVAFSPDGQSIAVGEKSRRVKLFTISGSSIEGGGIVHTARVDALCWNKDGTRVASGGMDGSIAIWPFDSDDDPLRCDTAHRNGVTGIAFTRENTLVTSGGDSCLRRWAF